MNLFDRARYLLSTRGPALTFRLHRVVYRASGGRLLPTSGRMPVLLLTTTGRKTGLERTWPLSYFMDEDRYVLVASNRGRDDHPGWYLNLTAHPEAVAQIGSERVPVVAEVASASDRARLWEEAMRLEPLYAAYQRGTQRLIPVVLLRPHREVWASPL